MSIAVFSNFVNGIPTTIFDGKDVSMVLLVNPPEELPAFFLANKGVLDTTSQTIKVYDSTGNNVLHDFDIAGTDLTPINAAISDLNTKVGINEGNIQTLDGLVGENSTNIATNSSDIGDLKKRASDLESTTSKHTTDILSLQGATGTNASDISALTLRVGTNETNIAAVLLTANAADTLSKQNKERLDNLPSPPSLDGYIKNGDDATLSSVSFGDNTKIDTQPDLGLVLQGDYIYGKADSGYEHFFVESGNFNVKSKKIQKVNDGQAEDDAVNKRQLGAVESKADSAQSIADSADSLSKSNQTAISNLSTTVGENTSGISTNAKDISDLSTKVGDVESTANAADTLSKDNASLLTNALLKNDYGWDVNQFNVYNVSRISRTNNAVNSSGVSIGDVDVNLHGDTVGITSGNSATTYAVFTAGGLNLNEYPLTRLGSGGDVDSNAANIGDVKRVVTEGSGLKPTDSTWDMLSYPVMNIGTSDVETSAATVGQVNAVESKIPSLDNYIQTGTTAVLNAVMFGDDTKIDHQNELGLVLQGDTIYSKSQSGYEHFFIEDGKFNVKSKVLQKLRDGVADDDAATVRQVNSLDAKVVQNTSDIESLGTTVGQNTTQISTNTSNITATTTTANAADTLSKENKGRLDTLPADVTPRVENLEANALQKDANGYDAKSFKILNVSSGEDVDTSAANIGDVKRIATEGSGLKPTENEWDMLGYPVTNVGTSEIATSAATVGQVNAVDSKVDTNAGAISNLSTTVGQHDTQIGTNTSNIATVTTTANNADALSKDNKTRLDNLPPAPDLSGYVQNGDDVNFGTAEINIVKVTKGSNHSKFSDILIDGNTNTQMNFVGDTHFYIRSKADNSKGLEVFQIDSSARFVVKQKIKTPMITNPSTGTTNSNTDKAGFIDLTQDNETKLGAKNSVLFDVGGNLSAGVYSDHVNFNTDYVTGVKVRDISSRQPYDAINWETLQGFTQNLEGYAKLGTAVNFADVTIDANGTLQSTTSLKVRIDGNETISFDKSAIYPKNNIVMGGKQITGLANGGGTDHAVNKGQLDSVSHRIGDVRSTTTWTHFTFNSNTLQDYFNGIGDTNEEKRSNFLEACAKAVDTRKGNSTSWEAVKIISGASPDWDTGSEIFPRYGTWVFRRKGNTARNELTWFNEHQTKRLYGSISTTGVFGGWVQDANQFTNATFEDVTANNLTLSSDDSLIKGNSTGTLIIQNAVSIRRNHTNDSNSVSFNSGNNAYKSDIHHFYDNDGNEQLKIQSDTISVKSKRITEVGDGTAITDVVNMRLARIGLQSNTVNIGGLDHLAIDGQTLEYWMNNMSRSESHTFYNRIRRARPTSTLGGAAHNNWICHYAFDNNSNIWNFLPSSVTPASGHMQILHEADLKARWVIWIGDKVLLSKSLTFNIGTGASGQPDTAFGIFDADGGGGSGGVEYENYITRSQDGSTTFYETTSGQQNAWVVATNNNQGTLTYTFDYSRQGQEVVAAIENKTKRTIIAKLKAQQSDKLVVEVPPYSVLSARYVPDIGHYVYSIGTWYPTEQRVITLDEINPTLSSDYRQMTLNIISAMPSHTTLIGYHNPDISGASKYKFVTTGATGTGKESSKCAVVIHKHINGHAVGLSTTEGLTGGRVYSRVLDGSTGVWNTNTTTASRSLSSEIDLEGLPEDQIFFTGDQGILESYIVDEETGEAALRPLAGYNVPKHESDIAALEIQTEKNRSVTHYFINESSLSYDWVDNERRPLVDVFVLNSTQTIEGSSVTVTDNASHKYSSEYHTVGSVCINSSGNWTVQYCYHNAYKHVSENWYIVVNQATQTWQIIEAENPHTSIGDKAASVTVNLGSVKSLPYSFGDYTIDPNFESIDSLEFLKAEVQVQYDDVNSRVLISFNGASPSGYVVLK